MSNLSYACMSKSWHCRICAFKSHHYCVSTAVCLCVYSKNRHIHKIWCLRNYKQAGLVVLSTIPSKLAWRPILNECRCVCACAHTHAHTHKTLADMLTAAAWTSLLHKQNYITIVCSRQLYLQVQFIAAKHFSWISCCWECVLI